MIPNSWTIKTQLRRAACFTLCLHCKLCTAVRTVLACVCVCSTAHVLLLTLVLFILFVFLLLIRQIQPRPQMGHRDPHVNFIMIGLQYRFRPATDLSHLKSGRHNWNICIFFMLNQISPLAIWNFCIKYAPERYLNIVAIFI